MQVLSALQRHMEAKQALTAAALIEPENVGQLQEMAIASNMMKDYHLCAEHMQPVVAAAPSADAFVIFGRCLLSIGNISEAITALEEATVLGSTNFDAWLNLGLCEGFNAYKPGYTKVERAFTKAIALRPEHVAVRVQRGTARYNAGRITEALHDYAAACEIDDTDADACMNEAHVLVVHGRLHEAAVLYQQQHRLGVGYAGSQLIQLEWLNRHANISRMSYSIDERFSPHLKHALVRHGWSEHCTERVPTDVSSFKKDLFAKHKENGFWSPAETTTDIRDAADKIGGYFAHRSPGFFANMRQLRISGMIAIELAQAAKRHFAACKPSAHSGVAGVEDLSFREWINLGVRWRQLLEPKDAVYWVDMMPAEDFQHGYGLETKMIEGQSKVVRYHVYADKSWALLKQCILAGLGKFSNSTPLHDNLPLVQRIVACDQPEQALQHVPDGLFSITPVHSLASSDVLTGSHLALTRDDAAHNGVSFSIRTPNMPHRWAVYTRELDAAWAKLRGLACSGNVELPSFASAAMELYYYWVNFGGMSRGTAVLGHAALVALLLAVDVQVPLLLAVDVQVPWFRRCRRCIAARLHEQKLLPRGRCGGSVLLPRWHKGCMRVSADPMGLPGSAHQQR